MSIMQRKQLKRESIIQLIIALAIIILIGVISNYLFTRFDLTSDKRYTLSDHTKKMLSGLDDIVYFKVYLDGDLPAGFKRLQNATREILDEFRAYGKDNIQYQFIDPAESTDQKTRNEVFKQLYDKGLNPTNLQVKEKDGSTSQKWIVPGIIVSYHGEEVPVNILKEYVSSSPESNLNSSIQALEYELTYAMTQLTTKVAPRIGFIEGHGELSAMEVDDIAQSLSEFYELQRVRIDGKIYSLRDSLNHNRFNLIIIAKPDSAFPEKDKFIIDQFLMNGGKALWLIDNVKVDMDSLAYSRSTLALNNPLNLDDQLFRYGVRLNPDLIQDMQCAVIPVNTAMVGEPPKFAPAPWLYFPLMVPSDQNVLTRNLDMVKAEFASVIDTVGEDPDVKKTILLTSSKYSRAVNAPVRVDLSMISEKIDPRRFNHSYYPVAVLLQGRFKSVFANRIVPGMQTNEQLSFKKISDPTQMIVISDGDMIRNLVTGIGKNRKSLPLGYDRYTKQTFGNKEFLINCINYLCGEEGIMESRSKEYKLRMLDQPKLMEHRLKWQIINVAFPVLLISILGLLYNYFRKKKFSN